MLIKIQTLKEKMINFFLFFLIISVPLSQIHTTNFTQIRIYFWKTSLSLLSLAEILFILSIFLEQFYKKNNLIKKIKDIYQENNYFLSLIFLLLFTLFLSVLKTNTFHAYGIFVEWFFLPILTNFFLLFYLKENKNNYLILKNYLIFSFSLVLIVSLIYWFQKNLTYDFRLKAFFLSPNHLAMFITSLFFIIFSTIFETKIKKIFFGILFFISLIILLKTNSLINLFLIFSGINFYLFYFYRNKFLLIIVFLLTFFILFFALKNKIPEQQNILQKNSIQSRLVIYNVSLNLVRKNLLIGKNLGNFQNEYLNQQKFYPPYPEWAVPTPHNFFIMNLFSAGLIFSIVFYLICFFSIFKIIIFLKKEKNKIDKKIKVFYLISILIFLFQGIFDTPYWKNDLSFIFWLTIILIIKNNSIVKKSNL